jgi:hypothetical protein
VPKLCIELADGIVMLVPLDRAHLHADDQTGARPESARRERKPPTAQALADLADVTAFVSRACAVDHAPKVKTRASVLYAQYERSACHDGRDPISIKRFKLALLARGFRQKQSDGMWWVGLRLLADCPRPEGGESANSGMDGLLQFPARSERAGRVKR